MRVYLTPEFKALGIEFSAPRPGDAGYDLFAVEGGVISPGGLGRFQTGLHVEIPAGYVGLVKDRSSMAAAGLISTGGVIDAAYRGEIMILLHNTNTTEYSITTGQKIAQMVVLPCYTDSVLAVDQLAALSDTKRGAQGFGSTGK